MAARAMDVNLICFVGGTLYSASNQFEYQRNVIYDLPNPDNVDGLLIVGSLGTYASTRELQDFHLRYRPLPTVSIDTVLEGIPSVVAEDRKGLHDAVTHLVDVHNCRRVGFIRGPENAPAANARYQAYIDTLSEHNILLDPNLVAPGDFLPDGGTAAVKLLLDDRQLRPRTDLQALIAANDNMALAAINALQERGIQVPHDIAVVGFDDIEYCMATTPSLTTIRQPIHGMARLAIGILLAIISGEQVPETATLPTKLVIRQSCGCSYTISSRITERKGPSDGQSLSQTLSGQRAKILIQLMQAIDVPDGDTQFTLNWAEQILDAFIISLEAPEEPDVFTHTLDDIIRQASRREANISSWYEIISILRKYTLPHLEDQRLGRAINLWEQAWTLIGEMAMHIPAQQRLWARHGSDMLYDVSQMLITQFDVTSLMDMAARELPKLGIKQCYISLYEDPALPGSHSWLALAYDEARRYTIEQTGVRYSTNKLIPHELLPKDRCYHLLVESLYLEDERIGFVIFGVGALDGVIYNMLQAQISGALKGVFLLQNRKQIEQNLAQSNQELEQFALAAFNGLQEPLSMVSSYLKLLTRRYQGAIDSDADEFIQYAVDGATRMQGLLNDLLFYARVETQGKACEPINCNKILDDVLANLRIAIGESGAIVTCDPLPTVMADDVHLMQLFQNLIGNAIKFRQKGVRPEVRIGVTQVDTYWQFSVRDNGIGIDPRHCGRLFTIFQRLHNRVEYPGTGIGLAICKKIVEYYGGRIWVESKAGEGAVFYFTLPILDIG